MSVSHLNLTLVRTALTAKPKSLGCWLMLASVGRSKDGPFDLIDTN